MASGWHRNDDDWVDNPKTAALQELLGEPLADAYVERLRCWTGRFRVRGRFAQDVVRHMEKLCGWHGEAGKLLEAFISTGWVDRRPDGTFEHHDWWEKQGPLVEKAEKDAARKRRERRAEKTRHDAEVSADGRADGAGTDGRNVRDETRRNVVAPPTPVDHTAFAIEPPTGPPASWLAPDFFAWCQASRTEIGFVLEKEPRGIGAWFSGACMKLGGDVERLCRAFEAFGQDKFWEAKGFPFTAFMSQWEKYTPAAEVG